MQARARSQYPPNWKDISYAVRYVRAEGRCEFCHAKEGSRYPGRQTVVRLAVAHLGVNRPDGSLGSRHDKSDCRPENLAALCQRCHLNLDRRDHQERRKHNAEARQRRRLARLGFVQLEFGYE